MDRGKRMVWEEKKDVKKKSALLGLALIQVGTSHFHMTVSLFLLW